MAFAEIGAIEQLFDQASLAYHALDIDGQILDVNQAWLELFACERQQVIGRFYGDFMERLSQNPSQDFNLSFKQQNQHRGPVFECRRRDNGERFWITLSGHIERDSHGTCLRAHCVLTDISDSLEISLASNAKAREQKQRWFLQQIDALDRNRGLSLIAAFLGHEVNQPLTAVLISVQVLKRYLNEQLSSNELTDELLDSILRNTRTTSDIIEKIRTLMQRSELESMRLDLEGVVQETANMIASELQRHTVKMHFEFASSPKLLMGDAMQIAQVLMNIYRNAIDAMQDAERREITVRLHHDDHDAQLSICDTGTGLTPESLVSAGTLFFTTKSQGLGMGLAICRDIIEQHHGKLTVAKRISGTQYARL